MRASKHFLHACLLALILAMPIPAQSVQVGLKDTILVDLSLKAALLLDGLGETERALQVLENFVGTYESSVLELKVRLLVKMGMHERADSILGLIMGAEDSKDYNLRNFALAEINLLAGRYEKALSLVESLDENSISFLGDYRDYIRMASLARLERNREAEVVGMGIFKKGYSQALTPQLESVLLEVLMENGEDSLALFLIENVKRRLDDKRKLLEFLSQEIKIYLKENSLEKAREIALEVAEEYSRVPGAVEILIFAESKIPFNSFGISALLSILRAHIENNDTQTPREIIAILKQKKLKPDVKERLRFEEACVLYLERDYQGVLTLLNRGFTIAALTRDSLLLKARAFRKAGNLLKAAVTYRHLALSYPYLSISPEALHVAAELFEKANYRTKSREIKKLLIEKYPNNYYGGLAALNLADFYMKTNNYGKSLSILRRAAKLSSKWREENIYYQSRIYERLGEEKNKLMAMENLRKIDRSSFYLDPGIEDSWPLPMIGSNGHVELYGTKGLMSFILTVYEKRMEAYAELEKCIKPESAGIRHLRSDESFRRAEVFLRFGFTEWAERELAITNARLSNNPDALFELGKYYNSNAMTWRGVRIFEALNSLCSRRIGAKGKNPTDILTYPIVFPGLIYQYCATHSLPPNLIFSLIREESRFHSKAISKAGAVGLMQLMPETGKSIADELGYPMEESSLLMPNVNLALGIEYASKLLNKCKGDYYMMLAAYNAGLSNARRWFNDSNLRYNVQEKVDNIDFKETRNYIRRVIESSHVYSSLYETDSIQ